MGRRVFNDGQEILIEDLNAIAKCLERDLYERVIHRMLGQVDDAFFEGSFKVSRTDADTISVAAGVGFQRDNAQSSPESKLRLVYRSSATSKDVTAAHATLHRIDVVSVKAALVDEITESRRFKDAITDAITDEDMVVQSEWEADIVVTAGTPGASPSAPATPAGYIKIAEVYVTASSGIAASGAITDFRTRFNQAKPAGYDAVVGSSAFCTHDTLAAAIAAASAGWKILVTENQTLSSTVTISGLNNIEIHAKPGVTFSKGSSNALGIDIDNCDGCRLMGLRFADFSTAGDKALRIKANSDYNFVRDCRFNSCDTEIDDLSSTSSILGNITE